MRRGAVQGVFTTVGARAPVIPKLPENRTISDGRNVEQVEKGGGSVESMRRTDRGGKVG